MTRRPLLFLALLLSLTAHAQSGMWGSRGIARRFVAREALLFVADGRGVAVYDTTNAASIRRVDIELSDGETRDVALSGHDLVVVASFDGLERFSNANGSLTRLGTITEEGGSTRVAANATHVAAGATKTLTMYRRNGLELERAWQQKLDFPVLALTFVGRYLYASIERRGIAVIDSLTGTEVDTLILAAQGFSGSGSMLWAAAGANGIFAIDTSDPAHPRIIGNAGGGEVNMTDIAVSGTRAFAIQPPDKLYTFDVSSPTEPRLVATRSEPAHVIAASGTRAFISGQIIDVYGLTRQTGVAVRVYDAQNLANLTVAGELHDFAGPLSGVATDGSVAWVVDPPFLRIIDISKTAAPRELSRVEVPQIQDSVRVKNGLAIIYGRGEVNLVDVSNLYAPKYLGTYHSTGTPPSAAALLRDTFVEANYASGLHIVDYSNPANPVQIAGRIWHYLDLAASDDAVYALLQNELLTLDLTDRNKVVDRKSQILGVTQVELAPPASPNPDLLVLREPQGFGIYSLADRFDPTEIFHIDVRTPGLMGTTAKSAWFEKNGFLWRIDLASPTVPLETHLRVTSPMQITGSGADATTEKLVIADRYSLRIYGPDTAAPPPPPPPPPPPKRRSVRR
ncbi:MAG TPA: hypothetical protein VGF48_26525 [Thermoanaerobaculia bacterium]|jgi:hypothetical protein